jgi:hypothetical protein
MIKLLGRRKKIKLCYKIFLRFALHGHLKSPGGFMNVLKGVEYVLDVDFAKNRHICCIQLINSLIACSSKLTWLFVRQSASKKT